VNKYEDDDEKEEEEEGEEQKSVRIMYECEVKFIIFESYCCVYVLERKEGGEIGGGGCVS
jgi:hypothetical protein